ncbi:unnamed protein product, partial [Prorocentrum cordatum]
APAAAGCAAPLGAGGAPPAGVHCFHVFYSRESLVPLGLGYQANGRGGLEVHALVKGLVAEANDQASRIPEPWRRTVQARRRWVHVAGFRQVGDVITSINGYTSPEEMADLIRTAYSLHLRVERRSRLVTS